MVVGERRCGRGGCFLRCFGSGAQLFRESRIEWRDGRWSKAGLLEWGLWIVDGDCI